MARSPFGSAPIRAEGQSVKYDDYEWELPIELRCYQWLEKAYPQIYKEFKAVDDITRGYKHE